MPTASRDGDPPFCEHGVRRKWLEKPEPYGWRGWFCVANVPSEDLCLPIFIGFAHQNHHRPRLRPHWPKRKDH